MSSEHKVAARLPLWVGAVITDETGRILVAKSAETRAWDLPGGHLTPGEDPISGLRRVVAESAGAVVSVWWLVGMHSHVREGLSLVFLGKQVGGAVMAGPTSEQVQWVAPESALRMLWPRRAEQLQGALGQGRPQQVVVTTPQRPLVPDLSRFAPPQAVDAAGQQ